MRASHIFLTCSSLLMIQASALADDLKIFVNSGTGFVVSQDGYIVTNLHVVNYCQRIIISGEGVSPSQASIVLRNGDDDLALLKINGLTPNVGEFSAMQEPLKKGDRVIIVGYPGESAMAGHTVTRESEIQGVKGPHGEDKWVQLGDVVEQGNSGGPLLDTAGNIIGVVSAKVMTYTYRKDQPLNGTTRKFGVAVSLPTVESFMESGGVRYRTSYSQDYLSSERITDNAHRFVVNVRCEYKTELR